ncbi:hypothetical protein SPRG_07836 [Saprolegnia parasitica CBS 223.65]|uniref:Uncharacterized protein n=1 Tax=Saprolegnia parasitica (strain CBS 223.65) TaxID=695850 RepID=A0A067CD70_SAPPC|nr:hypothetical protein SPRG_07836 [Saprolegnia parasitica CBS 223.65]KDO27125.1 hypothetical protein SPRG_07836 [Saprolegnia parasitica CBS 223.65]|eukprot:XP_012202218.1 hypothetical protein SPRG_07836 [Saprolegnia parasitica CBS 223.65]
MGDPGYGGATWGDDLQIYKAKKAVVPWRTEDQRPVKHVTRYEKSREEREYDLVRAEYRDVQREAAAKDTEIKARLDHVIAAKAQQSKYVQKHNLINHYCAEKEPVVETHRPPNTRVGYNIVTNVALRTPPSKVVKPEDAYKGKKMVESQHISRPFSVISNKYHTEHETRALAEAAAAKANAIAKFNKTRDFDPLLSRYYNAEKEMSFLAARDAHAKVHGAGRDDALPHGEQFSAGRLYNIINQKILRPDKYEKVTNVVNRRLNCMKTTQVNKAIQVRAFQEEDHALDLRLNRSTHARNSQAYVHGFDPVTNQPFDGRLRKPKVPLRTKPHPTPWVRLEGPSSNQVTENVLPRVSEPMPYSGLNQIQPEILFIGHDNPATNLPRLGA